MTQPTEQNPSCTQNPPKLLPALGKRAAYDAAKRDFFDLDREKPELIKLAKRHGVDIVALMQQSTRENWDSLRAAALAQRDLGASGLRLEAVQRVDRALVGQIDAVAQVAGRAYIDLIEQIAAMPTDDVPTDDAPTDDAPEPGSRHEKHNTKNEKLKTQSFKTRKGPRIKPLLLVKVNALNEATEGFSKFALSLRDLGMVLVPEKTQPESGGAVGNGSLPPGTLIQINQMLAGAMPQLRNVTPVQEAPPPPPPPPPPAPPPPVQN